MNRILKEEKQMKKKIMASIAALLMAASCVPANSVFNFSPDDLMVYNADEVIRGGTGYDIKSQLPDEIDRLQPDYSIYPALPKDTAYGFLTRGCPNKCPWCVVPRKEGKIRPYMDVDEIAIEGRKKLVLMDNNILAAGDYAVQQLEKIIERGYRVDFNQALDARLVNDEYARLLAKIKWLHNRIRFGCDTHGQIAECERAMALINGYGYNGEYFLYTMIGGKSDFAESYNRVHYWWLRNHEIRSQHRGNGIYPYAQPYRDPDNPRFTPPCGRRTWRRGSTSIRCSSRPTLPTSHRVKASSAASILRTTNLTN